MNNFIKHFTISNNKKLNDYIINQCKSNIDDYTIYLDDILKNIKENIYLNMYLFIIYKDHKIYIFFDKGDSRKKYIIEIVKRNILELSKLIDLPNFFLPFYVSDTHYYYDNNIPFFVEAKPRNQKGILYPDTNLYYINVEGREISYNELKKILSRKESCNYINDKEPKIFFSGANTGHNKQNIRMKLNDIVTEKNDKNYKMSIATKYIPLYEFCKYKYLLNLPGNQPWSYRMSKILLMNSLVIDVSVMQTYIVGKKKDKNDKWIQIYSDFFIPDEDYIDISYRWTENLTKDTQVTKIYNKINKIFKYYENNPNEYMRISNNAFQKANMLNNFIFDKTYQYLILLFIQKIYEENNKHSVNTFLDNMISNYDFSIL